MTKKRKIHYLEAVMKHNQVVKVVIVLLLILGLYSLFNMPRSEDPDIVMPTAMVYAFYPGADEYQVEQEVTNKIEEYLFSFEEIRKAKTKSETREGQAFITVEIYSSVKNRKQFWHTLQLDMQSNLLPNLPKGVVGPFVNSNFSDVTAMILSVSSSERSYAEIEEYIDKLDDGLKVIPTVSKINRSGEQQRQIYVSVNDEKLRQYGFDMGLVINKLQQANITQYTGELNMGSNTLIPIYSSGRFESEKEIANQIIYTTPEGVVVRLKDVATVERRFEEKESYVRVGEEQAMVLSINMQPGNNIVAFGETVQEKVDQIRAEFPSDIHIKTIVDQPEIVDDSIGHFMIEFGLAIASVIIVVMLLLPFRVAAVASITAPISIIITFGLMNMVGLYLHQVTLAGLIIVLGMVVDDAIVVVDNYIEKIDEGVTPWTAAWTSAKQLSLPIFTATIAIIFAFAPLAIFMDGVAQDFMSSLPVAIGLALCTSLVVALVFTPYTCYVFIKKGLKHKMSERKVRKKSLLDYLQQFFDKCIETAFRWPKVTLVVGFLSVISAFAVAGNLQEKFFPKSERNQFNLEVRLPVGASLERTEETVVDLENILRQEDRITGVTSFVGMSSPRFHTAYAPETPRRNYAQIFITTISNEDADDLAKEYLEKFKNYLPDGHIQVKQLSLQEGAPIAIRVFGEDDNKLKSVALQVKTILENAEGANYVRLDSENDYLGLKLNIDEDRAARLGISNSAITQALGAGLKGYALSTMWEGDKPVDIFVRYDSINRKDFDALSNIHISSAYGKKVPLKDVASLDMSWHTGMVAHRNGLKALSVLSEAQMGITPSSILRAVQPKIDEIELPRGVHIEYGGDAESTRDNQPNMMTSLGVSLILIFLTLLFQFKNLGKSLIVLSTFPLSLLGAFTGLFVTGNPIGMTAFMGIISLIGIVVRNGIILVDYTDELILDHGYSIKAAAMAASKRRMRPIFLTSGAAAVGVIPMILSKSPMWAPLGSVLAFGLLFSMVLTLFVVPVLYSLCIKPKKDVDRNQPNIDEPILYKPKHS